MLRQRALRLRAAVPQLRAARRGACSCGTPDGAHRRPPAGRAFSSDTGPPGADAAPPAAAAPVSGRHITHLLEANEKWAQSESAWFEEHGAKAQEPKYLWVGCSDSRVPAELMVGTAPASF